MNNYELVCHQLGDAELREAIKAYLTTSDSQVFDTDTHNLMMLFASYREITLNEQESIVATAVVTKAIELWRLRNEQGEPQIAHPAEMRRVRIRRNMTAEQIVHLRIEAFWQDGNHLPSPPEAVAFWSDEAWTYIPKLVD